MNYWLFKTEPDECSIDDFAQAPTTPIVWEGVRNYQARNFLRDNIVVGDQVFIYHSSCKDIGIAGVASVVKSAYPDPSQFDRSSHYFDNKATKQKPRWVAVDLQFVCKLPQLIRLDKLKNVATLNELPLVRKGNRLSVMPVTCAQWLTIVALSQPA
ncbi:EVE domain-containing protein [Arsukibacterium sp.]|uniref:EVE domain-containing protein n=1 Tax=Arsukibacterium sp. TaxID=1977258 RepID=UPI0035625570